MASPRTRNDLIQYCLRQLGSDVIEVNVSPDQIEDCVDDAIQMYQDFHSDGTLRTYLTYQLTQQDLDNGYIPLDESINYVSRLFPIGSGFSGSQGMFSVKYQWMLNDATTMHSMMGSYSYYEQFQQYMSMLDMQLNGTPQVQFSRRQNRLYIWGDLKDGDLLVGDYVVAEVFQSIAPNSATSIYNDRFIKSYTTALIKRVWGSNLSKFEGVQLPGGVTLNGRLIYEDAVTELGELKESLRLEGELPFDFYVG